jgi:Rrf2 family protein
MLSATSQYAMRALVHLAQSPKGASMLGRDLAKSADIPANFLAKILLILRNAGLVEATRGLGGGYRLAKDPDEITLMQVAELFEGINARPGCFLGEKHGCSDQKACTAHARWKSVCETYLQFMTMTTIADIGLKKPRSRRRLHRISR